MGAKLEDNVFKKLLCHLGIHDWDYHQHNVAADELCFRDKPAPRFVICWKQCRRCAKSKLVHILE